MLRSLQRVAVLASLAASMLSVAVASPIPTAAPLDSPAQRPFAPPVFTATRIYHTTTDVPPYIVTGTTTITWTQSPSTRVAQPTGPGEQEA